MKFNKLLFGLSFALFIGCNHHDRIIKKIDEVPKDVKPSQLCEDLYSNIMSLLRESNNNEARYPILFSDTVQHTLVLTRETEVYVIFVGEGASLNNTLGWYAYDPSNMPSAAGEIKQQVIFPHISNSVLSPGDTRQIGKGKFKAGTVIGFYLIVGGWNTKEETIHFNMPIHFTDFSYNPGQAKQSIIFREKQCNDIVIGFEDKTAFKSDHDFNDILFVVSDNDQKRQTVSFNLEEIPSL